MSHPIALDLADAARVSRLFGVLRRDPSPEQCERAARLLDERVRVLAHDPSEWARECIDAYRAVADMLEGMMS